MLSDQILLQLQIVVLKAVLLGEPLPGQHQPVRFPDLPFVTRQPAIYLLDRNLSGPITIEGYPRPIRILPLDSLLRESQTRGDDIAYLQFQPPEMVGDAVRLVLEAKIATRLNHSHLGLSNLQVLFTKTEAGWQVLDEPINMAI